MYSCKYYYVYYYIIITDKPSDAPANVRIPEDPITSGSFIVEWDPVTDFFTVNYIIRWYGEDGINGTATLNGPVAGIRLSYTVTGLNTSTNYSVTVHANNTCCGAGPVSNVTMTMTNMEPTTPPPTTSPPTTLPTTSPTLPQSPGNIIFIYLLTRHNWNTVILL